MHRLGDPEKKRMLLLVLEACNGRENLARRHERAIGTDLGQLNGSASEYKVVFTRC